MGERGSQKQGDEGREMEVKVGRERLER